MEDDMTGCACCTTCECEDPPEDGGEGDSACCGSGGC
jgi:hypothetical protein